MNSYQVIDSDCQAIEITAYTAVSASTHPSTKSSVEWVITTRWLPSNTPKIRKNGSTTLTYSPKEIIIRSNVVSPTSRHHLTTIGVFICEGRTKKRRSRKATSKGTYI
eukprot:scaffold8_cov142-Skeletonema_marinoi.AAC.7